MSPIATTYQPGDHVAVTLEDGTRAVGLAVSAYTCVNGCHVGLVLSFGGTDLHGFPVDRLDGIAGSEPITSEAGATRDHAVPCLRCRRSTWNHSAECDACMFDGLGR